MNNEQKMTILRTVGFTGKQNLLTKDELNSFFDESFVDYLDNVDDFTITEGQLRAALIQFDYSYVFINDHLTLRDKKLLIKLINIGVNISEIIHNFNSFSYNEFKEYIKQLYELGIISEVNVFNTNDISMIEYIIENQNLDYKKLLTCLLSHSIDDEIKRYILSCDDYKELFINTANVPFFYRIVSKLNLDESFVSQRTNKLKNILLNDNLNLIDLKDIVSELIFQDSYHNSMLNLELIADYCYSEKNVPDELLIVLKPLLYLKDLLEADNIEFFHLNFILNNFSNIRSNFNTAFKLVKKSFNDNLNKRLKSDENVHLVHTEFISNLTDNGDILGNYKKSVNNKFHRISFSLINDEKICVYGNISRVIVFGYNKSPQGNLISATLTDGRTAQKYMYKRSSYLSIDDFLKNTYSSVHNELVYAQVKELIYPDYILSFREEATELEQQVASLFNIPIKYLHKNNYSHDDNIIDRDKSYIFDDYKEIKYITNYTELNKSL